MKHSNRILHHPVIPIVILIAFVCIAFGNSLLNGFVSDDRWLFQTLPSDIGTIFKLNPVIHLINILWWLVYQIFQFTPWPYRLLNILAHITGTVFFYLIVKRLIDKRVAFLSALLFAVHPILVESVAWIAGGVYAWYGCLFILSFYAYIRASDAIETLRKNRSIVWFGLSYLFFVITILFSEKAIPLFLIYVVYEISRKRLKRHLKYLIPFVFIAGGFMMYYLTLLSGRMTGVAQTVGRTVEFYNPLIQIPSAFSMYFQLFIWPDRLSFYQSETIFGLVSFIIRVIVTVSFIVAWIVSFFRSKSRMFLWFSWFVIPLLPTLTPFQIAWIVAERYAYLSIMGLTVLTALLFDYFLSKRAWKNIIFILFIAVMIALTARTIIRTMDWRSEDTLWIATAKTAPSNQFTWNNMGDYYSRHGDLVNAASSFRRAIAIAPGYAPAYYNLAGTLLQMGETGDAILLFKHALKIKPDFWEVHRELASLYFGKGLYEEAINELTLGRALHANDPVMNQNYEMLIQIRSQRNKTP